MEVLPELAGKTITANASYQSVTDSSGSVPLKSAQSQALVIGNNGNASVNTTSAAVTDTPWGIYALVIVGIVIILGAGWYMMKRK